MRMYLLEKNLRLDPDLGPFWHPIPVAEIRNFNINRGRYTQLVPSRAPTGNPTGILYAFHRPADHPDPKRASPTVDLRKGSLIPVALFVKDATALWEAEEEVVRLWSMIEETKGVGMDPYDITKAHYGRAVLDFTAITAAKSLPRPPEQKKGSRSAPAKPQVFSGHWPKCTTELINHVKKGQPWDWGIPTGPPPRVPGASPPPKVLDNAYREMRTGSLLVAAKEQKQREDDKKAMEKANRKPATVAIAFKPHPSVAQPPKKQATLPSLFGRYSNSNTSITLPRTPPTSVESSSRSYEANGEELGELPQPVSSRNAHGSRGSPSCPKINPRASSGARQAYIHDDEVVDSEDWPLSPVIPGKKRGQGSNTLIPKRVSENTTKRPSTVPAMPPRTSSAYLSPKPRDTSTSPIVISSDDPLGPMPHRHLPMKIPVRTKTKTTINNKENRIQQTTVIPKSPIYVSSDGPSSPLASGRASRSPPPPPLRPSLSQLHAQPQKGVRGLSASMKVNTSKPKRRRV